MKKLKDLPAGMPECPVDRGKILIGLEHCRDFTGGCMTCPYLGLRTACMRTLTEEALAYILQLEEALNHDGL